MVWAVGQPVVLETFVKTDGLTNTERTIRLWKDHLINNSFIFHPKLTAMTQRLRLPGVKLP